MYEQFFPFFFQHYLPILEIQILKCPRPIVSWPFISQFPQPPFASTYKLLKINKILDNLDNLVNYSCIVSWAKYFLSAMLIAWGSFADKAKLNIVVFLQEFFAVVSFSKVLESWTIIIIFESKHVNAQIFFCL